MKGDLIEAGFYENIYEKAVLLSLDFTLMLFRKLGE